MGQSSSRHRQPTPAQTPRTAEETTSTAAASGVDDTHLEPPVNRVRHTSDVSGSRRSSVRKSILNLVKPSNIRSRVTSVTSTPGDIRRSWRNSRRWSRVPVDAPPQFEEAAVSPLPSSSRIGPSTLGKGKEPERDAPSEEEQEGHTEAAQEQASQLRSAGPSTEPSAITEPASPEAESQAAVKVKENEEHSSEPIPISSTPQVSETSEAPASTSTAPPLTPRPHTVPLPQRQFPPPGTLVIVQGVVHTTDISRTPPQHGATSSTPTNGLDGRDEASRSRTRNRLSALLRPQSASRRSSTIVNEPTPTLTVTPPPETEAPTSASDESLSSSEDSAQTGFTTPAVDEMVDSPQESQQVAQPPEPTPPPETRLPSVSSSSIDVLGTLLSVAAAATAASLLTGSSEPILSSGLAPPPASSSSSSVPSTPPAVSPYPRLVPDISAASRAERMRQAWSTIRERLGLRPSAPPSEHATPVGDAPASTLSNGDGTNSVTTDARELMLAEMARAFNIGLGLNGLGGLSPTSGDGTSTAAVPADEEAVGGRNGTDNETGDTANTANVAPSSTAGNQAEPAHMPPEGSFERFLVDLQIDLRTALTHVQEDPEDEEEENEGDESPHDQPADSGAETSHSVLHSQSIPQAGPSVTLSQPSTSSAQSPVDVQEPVSCEHHTVPPLSSISPDTDLRKEDSVSEAVEPNDASSTHSMPQLTDLSNSDSESDSDEDNEYDEDHNLTRGEEHRHDRETENGPTETASSGSGRIDASGRINWWRLYRFPPITSSGVDLAGLRQAPGTGEAGPSGSTQSDLPTTSVPAPTSDAVNQLSVPTSPASASQPSSQPGLVPTETPPISSSPQPNMAAPMTLAPPSNPGNPPAQLPLRTVVPVIIVGLQSVNSEWRPDVPVQGENEGMDFFGQPSDNNANPGGSDVEDEDDADPWGTATGPLGPGATRGRGRSRGWQSRAANAIRNLRPGRRNAEANAGGPQNPSGSNGSRTFLIYVIGGYYPPDHSIVTGGPNNFDSFEALLELADLLGQVKPPTVSKDEIEKSGLEVVKASQLGKYFEDGKVTANCLDRCLVCLEDYQPEEDVRLLKCRHVFHKTCVDHWMEKGRNNCPACRSTGVSADSRSPGTTPV